MMFLINANSCKFTENVRDNVDGRPINFLIKIFSVFVSLLILLKNFKWKVVYFSGDDIQLWIINKSYLKKVGIRGLATDKPMNLF